MSLNFECHITCHAESSREAIEAVAEANHWKYSCIDGDPVLGQKRFQYLTKHGTAFQNLHGHAYMTKGDLERAGVQVLRVKIELILHDTKTGVGT